MLPDRIAKELEEVRARGGGLLLPSAVVDFAKDEGTALHSQFEWDDSIAAREHRLAQARHVIRLHVTIIAADTEPVRAFVSLSSDRIGGGGGYRATADVIENDVQRGIMLADALDELRRVQRKYRGLKALKVVWDALDLIEESPPTRATG